MRIYPICIFVLIFDLYDLACGDLPNVPSTVVITPPSATPSTILQPSLTIYYDAMEEYSQVFFNTTLVNVFSCFSCSVDISFIPCQQAKKDQNGDLSCPAKADPACNLDKIHSCAIAQALDKTQLVNFLACTMSTVKKLPDFLTCAIRYKFDDKQLQSCASSDTGKNLCKNNSNQKMPNCNTMPGFVFKNPNDIQANDPFEHLDNYINNICVTDFKSALCAQLKATTATSIPPECNQKLVMGIFYKAMDAASQKWFQTFATVYEKFSSCLTLKYQPCMFAELSDTGTLDCKDPTDTDCIAAKTHACAVSKISDPKALFQFLSCAMKDATKVPDFEKCATDNNIIYEPIKTCASSDTGKQLCFDYSKTRPKSDKVPSFSYELTYHIRASTETSLAANLQFTLCSQMKLYSVICPACPCGTSSMSAYNQPGTGVTHG
ncbi:uncharacterized protein LOC135840859 [Planococcus citri]|uniref:uncharacterized protein LOC135840859 n=1 Tax=Planococcus citri TaxID=170843 RepID=UPI0031F8A0BC